MPQVKSRRNSINSKERNLSFTRSDLSKTNKSRTYKTSISNSINSSSSSSSSSRGSRSISSISISSSGSGSSSGSSSGSGSSSSGSGSSSSSSGSIGSSSDEYIDINSCIQSRNSYHIAPHRRTMTKSASSKSDSEARDASKVFQVSSSFREENVISTVSDNNDLCSGFIPSFQDKRKDGNIADWKESIPKDNSLQISTPLNKSSRTFESGVPDSNSDREDKSAAPYRENYSEEAENTSQMPLSAVDANSSAESESKNTEMTHPRNLVRIVMRKAGMQIGITAKKLTNSPVINIFGEVVFDGCTSEGESCPPRQEDCPPKRSADECESQPSSTLQAIEETKRKTNYDRNSEEDTERGKIEATEGRKYINKEDTSSWKSIKVAPSAASSKSEDEISRRKRCNPRKLADYEGQNDECSRKKAMKNEIGTVVIKKSCMQGIMHETGDSSNVSIRQRSSEDEGIFTEQASLHCKLRDIISYEELLSPDCQSLPDLNSSTERHLNLTSFDFLWQANYEKKLQTRDGAAKSERTRKEFNLSTAMAPKTKFQKETEAEDLNESEFKHEGKLNSKPAASDAYSRPMETVRDRLLTAEEQRDVKLSQKIFQTEAICKKPNKRLPICEAVENCHDRQRPGRGACPRSPDETSHSELNIRPLETRLRREVEENQGKGRNSKQRKEKERGACSSREIRREATPSSKESSRLLKNSKERQHSSALNGFSEHKQVKKKMSWSRSRSRASCADEVSSRRSKHHSGRFLQVGANFRQPRDKKRRRNSSQSHSSEDSRRTSRLERIKDSNKEVRNERKKPRSTRDRKDDSRRSSRLRDGYTTGQQTPQKRLHCYNQYGNSNPFTYGLPFTAPHFRYPPFLYDNHCGRQQQPSSVMFPFLRHHFHYLPQSMYPAPYVAYEAAAATDSHPNCHPYDERCQDYFFRRHLVEALDIDAVNLKPDKSSERSSDISETPVNNDFALSSWVDETTSATATTDVITGKEASTAASAKQ